MNNPDESLNKVVLKSIVPSCRTTINQMPCRKKDSTESLKFIKEFAKGSIHNLKNLSTNTDGTLIKEKSLV